MKKTLWTYPCQQKWDKQESNHYLYITSDEGLACKTKGKMQIFSVELQVSAGDRIRTVSSARLGMRSENKLPAHCQCVIVTGPTTPHKYARALFTNHHYRTTMNNSASHLASWVVSPDVTLLDTFSHRSQNSLAHSVGSSFKMDEELDQFEPKAPSGRLKNDIWADLSLCSHLTPAPPLSLGMWSTLVIPALKKPRQENHRVRDTVNSRPDCATQATLPRRDETQAKFTFNFGVFQLKPTQELCKGALCWSTPAWRINAVSAVWVSN